MQFIYVLMYIFLFFKKHFSTNLCYYFKFKYNMVITFIKLHFYIIKACLS
uniref:Uncharacterized protein n=1 Tax=Polysiphonia scopulorum TaxID=257860 RepID=A0A1Z1MII1_9FLOR|nr:hypothetical protein [Polysiphonia scopulorum]ARW65551.1 hypothetical protein [Polysiphonia scopulorum]